MVLPASNVFRLPAGIPDEIASILDPLGNATHAALSFNMVGEDVLITGAGPIGIMAVAIARFIGARHVVITDVNDYRLDLARRMGATRALNVKNESIDDAMRELGMEEGFDVGLEMSGNASAFRDMVRVMHHGGSIAMLGIPPAEVAIDWNQVIFKGLVIKGIYGREMFETWYKMAAMLQSGLDVSGVITHRFGAADYGKAFDTMGGGQSGKVILDWDCPLTPPHRSAGNFRQGDCPLLSPPLLHPARAEVDRPALRREREQRAGAIERARRAAAASRDAARRHSRPAPPRRAGA